MSGEWITYADACPAKEGVYEWRVPSAFVPGLILVFAAKMRTRGAGYRSVLSPSFDHWDGYSVHVQAGTQWRETSRTTHDVCTFAVEGLSPMPCAYCGAVPRIHGDSYDAHLTRDFHFECCQWAGVVRMDDPRKIEAARRAAYARAAEILGSEP